MARIDGSIEAQRSWQANRYRALANTRRSRTRRARVLVAIAIAIVIALIAIAAMLGAAALLGASHPAIDSVTSGLATGNAGATSTPRSEWRLGEMPYLYQTDPAWASEPYAGDSVEKNGCGPTCLSMVYICLTGRADKDPAKMAAFADQGGYNVDGATSWTFMTEGAAMLGLSSTEVPADASCVRSILAAGTPIICSVRPGDFTTTGHFIVLAGIDENGNALVHDPNSSERSRAWDVQRIIDQCANIWAFELA